MALEDGKALPSAFRRLLPCVTLDGTVSDIPRDILMCVSTTVVLMACDSSLQRVTEAACLCPEPLSAFQIEARHTDNDLWIEQVISS